MGCNVDTLTEIKDSRKPDGAPAPALKNCHCPGARFGEDSNIETAACGAMFKLTKQQQLFLCVVLLLLITGWAVRAWRTAHPPPAAGSTVP